MSTKVFLTVGATLALGFGLAFLLAPAVVFKVYGVDATPQLLVAYRYFSVALIAVGLVIWPIRLCKDATMLRPILIGHAISDAVGVLVSIWAGVSGVLNGFAWLNVVIYVGLTAGAIYCSRQLQRTNDVLRTADLPYGLRGKP